MGSVRLVPMEAHAYEAWYEDTIGQYAEDHARSDKMTLEQALARARQEFLALLPDGRLSPGMHLFTALDAATGDPVGMFWLAERQSSETWQAFLYDIQVLPARRGQGYGRGILAAAEEEARRLGLGRIALHVFGHNRVAIRLYETAGYQVTNMLMAKDL